MLQQSKTDGNNSSSQQNLRLLPRPSSQARDSTEYIGNGGVQISSERHHKVQFQQPQQTNNSNQHLRKSLKNNNPRQLTTQNGHGTGPGTGNGTAMSSSHATSQQHLQIMSMVMKATSNNNLSVHSTKNMNGQYFNNHQLLSNNNNNNPTTTKPPSTKTQQHSGYFENEQHKGKNQFLNDQDDNNENHDQMELQSPIQPTVSVTQQLVKNFANESSKQSRQSQQLQYYYHGCSNLNGQQTKKQSKHSSQVKQQYVVQGSGSKGIRALSNAKNIALSSATSSAVAKVQTNTHQQKFQRNLQSYQSNTSTVSRKLIQQPSTAAVPIISHTRSQSRGEYEQSPPISQTKQDQVSVSNFIETKETKLEEKAQKADKVPPSKVINVKPLQKSLAQKQQAHSSPTQNERQLPQTYKQIKQRLVQQQQAQYVRQQRQLWIQRQQQLLFEHNPGATLDQVNSVIHQSLLNQQDQLNPETQATQIQALQQIRDCLTAPISAPSSPKSTTKTDHEVKTVAGGKQLQLQSHARTTTISTSKPLEKQQRTYLQLLKQECRYDAALACQFQNCSHPHSGQLKDTSNNTASSQDQQANTTGNTNSSLQPTNIPHENLKQQLQQLTSEITRKVLARSDSMNQLRQIIDLKAKKVKPKNYESVIFQTIMDKEQTRVKQEADCLAKQGLKVEDKILIKYVRGQVKKMLKPFRGLQYDDFLNNDIHLNEIMATTDQQNDPIKESRKRHLRILDAALKESVVDINIALGICVQISRQAFYNELKEYFTVAYDYIMGNLAQFQQHDIQAIQVLKKRVGQMRSSAKIQMIQSVKKLDRMFWLLLEQNQDVKANIKTYNKRYREKQTSASQAPQTIKIISSSKQQSKVLTSSQGKSTAFAENAAGSKSISSPKPENSTSLASPNVSSSNSKFKSVINSTELFKLIKSGTSTSISNPTASSLLKQTAMSPNNTSKHNKSRQSRLHHQITASTGAGSGAHQALEPIIKLQPVEKSAQNNDQMIGNGLITPNDSQHPSPQKVSSTKSINKNMITFIHHNRQGDNSSGNTGVTDPAAVHHRNTLSMKVGTEINSANSNNKLIGNTAASNGKHFLPSLNHHHKQTAFQQLNNESCQQQKPFTDRHKQEQQIIQMDNETTPQTEQKNQKQYKLLKLAKAGMQLSTSQSLKHNQLAAIVQNTQTPTFDTGDTPPSHSVSMSVLQRHQVCTCAKFNKRIDASKMMNRNSLKKQSFSSSGVIHLNSANAGLDSKSAVLCDNSDAYIDQQRNQSQQLYAPLSTSSAKTGDISSQKLQKIITSGTNSKEDAVIKQSSNSAEFMKMRILTTTTTVKKETTPLNDIYYNDEIKSRKILQQSNQNFLATATPIQAAKEGINKRKAHMSGLLVPLSASHSNKVILTSSSQSSTLKQIAAAKGQSRFMTFELCQDCGGQRPVGLPQVTIRNQPSDVQNPQAQQVINSKKLRAHFHYPQPEADKDNEGQENGLNDDSSFTDGDKTLHLSQNEDGISTSTFNERVEQEDFMVNLYINRRYIIGDILKLQKAREDLIRVVALNRVNKIQVYYRNRFYTRSSAVRRIQRRWRQHKVRNDQVQLFDAKLQHLRMKFAINRIYDLQRLIKIRKVAASSMLVQDKLSKLANESLKREDFLDKVVFIQRQWRATMPLKFLTGKVILARKSKKVKVFETVLKRKYTKTQQLESTQVYNASMFAREDRNLEGYFERQMLSYTRDLNTKAAKIEHQVQNEFNLMDWKFDNKTRVWSNFRDKLTIKLEKNEASQITILRRKLCQFYMKKKLPSEREITAQIDDMIDAKRALQKALAKEMDLKTRHLMQKLKTQRLQSIKLVLCGNTAADRLEKC